MEITCAIGQIGIPMIGIPMIDMIDMRGMRDKDTTIEMKENIINTENNNINIK